MLVKGALGGNADLSSIGFSGIQLTTILQEVLKISIHEMVKKLQF